MAVKVKICGITNSEDAICAVDAGADLLGFIFVEKSPRYIEYACAAKIVNVTREHCAMKGLALPKFAGVFVNQTADSILAAFRSANIDYAQLHGDETLEEMAALRRVAYKALRPSIDPTQAVTIDPMKYAELGITSGPSLLVDAYSADAYGGTGELANWHHASELAARIDGFVLAGGLNPANVQAAIAAVKPWGVDVSSGVEAKPGHKDHEAVRAFISAAKSCTLPHGAG